MSEEHQPYITAPKPALFDLDLGANGGRLAPDSVDELLVWVQREVNQWSWVEGVSGGNYKSAVDNALQPLFRALGLARDAHTYDKQGNDSALKQRLAEIQGLILEAYVRRGLPHSSSPLARRIAALEDDPRTALSYMFPFLPVLEGHNYQFDGRDLSSWRGFIAGLIDRFDLATDVEPAIEAERQALESLHVRAENMLGDKKQQLDELHRYLERTSEDIREERERQKRVFEELVNEGQGAHHTLMESHEVAMESLQKAFREAMTLRAPVDYWSAKAANHSKRAAEWMFRSFTAMALLGGAMALLAIWVFFTLNDGRPDSWKVAVLVLLGVLGVWAVRLIVRMFLSHMHLATDAEERVTMVQTYLALLESEKMPSDEDRKLVLGPLFRPAADGLVKDEGMPHPLLELFTRTGQR